MSLLEVKDLSHTAGDNLLYKNVSFDLYKGEHVGVVGQNGVGKSTLVGILAGVVIPDKGSVRWQPKTRVGYLDQYAAVDGELTILDYLKTAFTDLYEWDRDMHALYDRYAQTGDDADLEGASELQARLDARDYYTADTRIDKVCNGLGLTAIGVDRRLDTLSGGQRAKVILAKLLLEQPDVLLLDEPTNFLDAEHIAWFVDYLSGFRNAYVVVSHDYEFLEQVSTHILDVESQTIRKYHGKYSEYLKQKEHYREDYVRQYHAQQKKIKETEEFIRRNIAGVNTKMAQGRRKHLERLERIEAPKFNMPKPVFQFSQLPLSAQEALKTRDLEIGYYYALLPKLNLSIENGQRIAITGFNGIGKSTLIKTLTGHIPPIAGSFTFAEPVKIGYFEQELEWDDDSRTPLQIMAEYYPDLTQKEARKRLAKCGVSGEHATQVIGTLSGGEQAKVKMCLLVHHPCNFLILDEPTNHLDADAKEALAQALNEFTGCVLLVSHEEAFYRNWADRVINIEDMYN